MRERRPLKQDTQLIVRNRTGGSICYIVGKVIGEGGSCLVYEGYYQNNAGTKTTVRIKECYPYKLHLERNENGELLAENGKEKEQFLQYKNRLKQSFAVIHQLHESEGLTNYTANIFDIYETNHTVYIVSSYVEGDSLAESKPGSLRDVITIGISTAKCIERIHKAGYLYLDIKPENILIYKETTQLVQLFDFDSVIPLEFQDDITEYKISYSPGYAPIEQKSGRVYQIGTWTDIYSIGALLFYLLFGRTPGALDCGKEAEYDYSQIKWDELYQKKLYKELNVFFHHTLQAYYKDRYQNMSEVIEQLSRIEQLVDLPVPFICCGYVTNGGVVAGRKEECDRIRRWCQRDEKILFVTGMGGIGKSTVVREFAAENEEMFDQIIYIQFRGSVYEAITDDGQFYVNGCEKEDEESTEDYFARKMKMVRELTANTNALFILDNFDGNITEEFNELSKVNWKMIVVTRSDMEGTGYTTEKIKALESMEDIYCLFETNMGRKLKKEEFCKVAQLAEIVERHTLVLTLLAKQMDKSFLSFDEALKLVSENGFSRIAPEKINYMQDGILHYEKISAIIRTVYDVSALSDTKRKYLKFISLFDIPGLEGKYIREILQMESLDEINELKELGWIEIIDNRIQMHPLIQETIHQMAWTKEYRRTAQDGMRTLLHELESLKENQTSSKRKMQVLHMAQSILRYCGEDAKMTGENIYKDLLLETLLHMPREHETYIIQQADKILKDPEYMNVDGIMDLYDYVVYLICQKKEFSLAAEYIKQAKRFAVHWKTPYLLGRYYDMLGTFYDAVVDGAYDSRDGREGEWMEKMLRASDLAGYYMKKSQNEKARNLFIKYTLEKAVLLIRNKPEKKSRIKSLLLNTKKEMEKYFSLVDGEVRQTYEMTWAWYYTYCETDERKILMHLRGAAKIEKQRSQSDLDKIDYFYIPAANMMLETGDMERTMYWLEKACDLCEKHQEELPYMRKKMDLLCYELETHHYQNGYDNDDSLLEKIGQLDRKAREYGVVFKIPWEIAKEI